ncbi:MAG TPA: EAL domain-containing protein [Micromonosporaceae bacterium]|jgi:diguanylate cyclase (GGDEF)-like protein|nr:EAL domain-containing protein [Micromonosporaceae bacterium]
MYSAALRNTAPPEHAKAFFGYVTAVCVVALALVIPAIPQLRDVPTHSPATYWLLAFLAVIADLRPFPPPGRQRSVVFPSICFTFAILLMWGFDAAVVVQTAAVVASAVRLQHRPWRAAFNAAQYAISFAAASAVLHTAEGMPFAPGGSPGWPDVGIALTAAAVWFVVNNVLVTTAVALRFGGSWWHALRRNLADDALTTGSLLLLGPVLVGTTRASAALIPLVIVPLLAVNRMARLSSEQNEAVRTDPLTRLANRKALQSEVGEYVATCQHRSSVEGREHRFALMILDIDRFKYVNDALGHAVGDRLLVEISQRIDRAVPDGNLVARLGGDEFAVVAPEIDNVNDARSAAGAIAGVLSVPVVLDGMSLDVGGSIGIAIYPTHGEDFETLLRHADVAMYDAKARGDALAVYAPEVDHNSPDRLSLLADLRRALENTDSSEVMFYYQPQVEMATGTVTGVEALLRWHHPHRGLVDPEELIRVAEHSGVMRMLTLRVVDDVVAQLAKWRANGLAMRAAINVSVRDLHSGEVVDRLAEQLGHYNIAPDQVQMEITEGALMADPRRVLATLQRLARLGVALSLDDFGTGYSSMQHLRRLPLSEVKIDRSFVLGMADDPDDEAIVRSMIDLAGALNLRVVAEGVEDDRTRRMLVACGCHVAQGWYYARPMPADELASWLARYRPPEQYAWPATEPPEDAA